MSLYLSRTIRRALLLWAVMPMKQSGIAPWTHQPRQFAGHNRYIHGGEHVSD
jgi:hypothetical protein